MSRWLAILCTVACCSSSKKAEPTPGSPTPGSNAPAAIPSDASANPEIDPGSLGALTFPVSDGTPAARAHFARGLLALHSFWYDEATREFEAAIATDPSLRMAYWGAAMSHLPLLWGNDDLTAAKKMFAMMPDPDGLSPREQAWVEASLELITGTETHVARVQFAKAMETVNAQFPDDESATFLAIALLSASPEDTAVRLRAADLALTVWKHNPKHPGAAHYAIHALDTPELASRALPLARTYAQIAPGAFHARHMPAHIFSRLGMWPEAIASCQAAWDASLAAAKRDKLSADHDDFHSLDWLINMDFEIGRRSDADAALALYSHAVTAGLDARWRGQYAIQVTSYMMRTGEWSRVEELLAPLARPASADAMMMGGHCGGSAETSPAQLIEQFSTVDARAWAAAMQRDRASTDQRIKELDAVRAQLRPLLPAGQLAALDAAHARHRRALLARARDDDKALIAVLREQLADDHDTSGETQLGGIVVREQLADALAKAHRPDEAAAEYAHVLATHPNRARSLLGAARNDPSHAASFYETLRAQWAHADPTTDGLPEARAANTK